MRVGVSLLTLVPGEVGGSETYVRQLLETLAARRAHEYVAFVPEGVEEAAAGLPVVPVGALPFARRGPARIPASALAARSSRAVRASLRELDVVHYPLTVPVPRARSPRVVTLHDLQHRDLPELFSRSQRAFRSVAYDRAARAADAVVVFSEFVRERATELLRLPPARVHVIPHGVDRTLFHPGEEAREPFLLYPARGWPHKNHARLLDAFALLRSELPELRLVLTGGGLDGLRPLPEGVSSLGGVSLGELASLYRRAACLVFPSLYEGFGLPLLEAMACGCPVAAASAGAIPEVCGGAAVLFDPANIDAIANGVRDALGLADVLGASGVARAAGFTWEESARAHEDVYRSAAGS